jgi:hypothetical protein
MCTAQIALEAPTHVRLEKQSILGVFDLGFRDQVTLQH